MNQHNMSVEPEIIYFEKCDSNTKIVNFSLTNKSVHSVAWKVKMTAPKRYKMEPKRGVILPLGTAVISVRMVYSKYPPNLAGNEKRERDSNGVFVDRYQFESVVINCETPQNYMRNKTWWSEIFKNAEISVFKAKAFFTLLDSFPQSDIDALLLQLSSGNNHSQVESGFLELSQTLRPQDLEKSLALENSLSLEKSTSSIEKSDDKIQLSPRKESEKPFQEHQKPEQLQSPQRSSSIPSQPTTPVHTPQKLSASQSSQQPILRPPEKSSTISSPLKSPLKQNITTEETNADSIQQHPIKELKRVHQTTHNTSLTSSTTGQQSLAIAMGSVLGTLVMNNLVIIFAFLLGYFLRWYYPF
jgi:hypothetical protein